MSRSSQSRTAAPGAVRPAGALIGGIERDPFGDQMVDGRLRIEAQKLVQSGIDHRRDSFDRE